MIDKNQNDIIKQWRGDVEIPIVSILCLTYNHEKFISEAIDGFLMQKTNFPFEIIISDDFSLDDTLDVIRTYEAQYPNLIKVLNADKNQGVYKNAVKVLSTCIGKYIAVCEGDDYWTDDKKLQKQFNLLDQEDKLSGIYHSVNIVDENNNEIKKIPSNGKDYMNLPDFFDDYYQIPTCSIMFKNFFKFDGIHQYRRVFKGANFILDYLLDALIVDHGVYKYLDENMGCYRVTTNTGSFSSQKISTVEDEMLRTRSNLDRYYNYKYTKYLNKSKSKVRMSILLKVLKQNGVLKFLQKFLELSFMHKIELIVEVFKYANYQYFK
jgi:glycosyltransferase involved in cell wall biosynthesis